MFDITDDYLIAGEALQQLLKNSQKFKHVYQANELQEVDEKSQVTPSAHVIYIGDKAQQSAQGGNTSKNAQLWAVVIACRQSIHESPGKSMVDALNAVTGKTLQIDGLDIGPFKREQFSLKPMYTKSHAYMPLVFSVHTRFNPKT